jgi:hypothetical protein
MCRWRVFRYFMVFVHDVLEKIWVTDLVLESDLARFLRMRDLAAMEDLAGTGWAR